MTYNVVSGPWTSRELGSVTSKTYRFPLETGGAATTARARTCWDATVDWFAGPWALNSWIEYILLFGGLAFQIGFVFWFSDARPRGPEYIHQMYSFLAWLLMSAMLIVMSVPYVLFLEPIISTFAGGSSIGGTTVRKPLLVVLGVVAATVLLFTSVLPSIDGTYADHMPYLYIAGEGAFLTGWFFGMTYCIAVAVSKPGYPLAHIGITPAIVGVIFLLSGLAAAGMVKGWMINCNTGEDGGGPWDGCTGALAGDGMSMGTASDASTGGASPTDSCPCPNAAGTKCNCPFDNNCNIQSECYNPGGGHIPSGCKMGCMG